MKLFLSQQGVQHLEQLQGRLSGATLLTGQRGVGLQTIASEIGRSHGHVRILQPELQTKTSSVPQISIDQIRQLYVDTRGKAQDDHVIIIDDADRMTVPAQNSFLKLLEEPNLGVHFILTSHHPERLLPTVRSRAQSFDFPPISDRQTDEFLTTVPRLSAEKKAQLLFIAHGRPAALNRLAGDEVQFEALRSNMTIVRQLLAADRYTRARAIATLSLDRAAALQLIETIVDILTTQPDTQKLDRLSRILACYDLVRRGGNIKLQLMAAVV